MARRAVGNPLALAVLGTLIERPMHPYELATLLRERGKDKDMPIKWGSLYTVVGNLDRHGFIAVVESARQGGRPERTVYRITDAGRAELADWLRDLLSSPDPEPRRFTAGLSFLGVVPPDEAIALLRERVNRLDTQVAEGRAELDRVAERVPRPFLIESEYDLAMRRAEAEWTRTLLAELASGSMPGMDWWRAWHETGQVPPELTEGSGPTD